MLHQEIIRLVNSGQAVAFVGSGPSTAARLPSWDDLYQDVRSALLRNSDPHALARADRLAGRRNLPGAFGALKKAFSSEAVDQAIRDILSSITEHGPLHSWIADWPFRFYITTNFDNLLSSALQALGPERGPWISIGNTAPEIRKVTADPEGLVWYPHGCVKLESSKVARLVVGDDDYAELYPDSRAATVIEAIAQQRRLVFVGFGFRDPDLLHLLQTVARRTSPDRPAFAFLGQHATGAAAQAERDEYREKYNVEVIPYRQHGGNHSALAATLQAYSPFIVRRTINLGKRPVESPEYDPQATGLQVHNRICEYGRIAEDPDISNRLIRSWILSRLEPPPHTISNDEIRPSLIEHGIPISDYEAAIESLRQEDLVHNDHAQISLTDSGVSLIEQAKAAADLEKDKFIASLTARIAQDRTDWDESRHVRVATIASSFFEGVSRTRGLGIAQNLIAQQGDAAEHRSTALIASLPESFELCQDEAEAFALVSLVMGVLSAPREAEAAYLGSLTQAYFGQHLLRAVPEVRDLQRQVIADTCFLFDSSVLVCLLARGCEGHRFATRLVDLLREIGSPLVTSDLFLEEAREHAAWAARLLSESGEDESLLIDVARGARGFRPNLFVEGFLNNDAPSFPEFLKALFPTSNGREVTDRDVAATLSKLGILPTRPDQWDGFEETFWTDRDQAQQQITTRRMRLGTYKHERQVRTEADAALLVGRIRGGMFGIEGRRFQRAFLVSHTRVIDGLDGLPGRIVILPEGLFQWLLVTHPFTEDEAEALFGQLLWDLSQSQTQFVSREQVLRRFGHLIEVARADLEGLIADHHDLVTERFGPDPNDAFAKCSELDLPFIARSATRAALERARQRADSERRRAEQAEKRAKLSDAERDELTRLRAKKDERRKRSRQRQRAAASGAKKKKKKKKGKKGGRKK